MVSVKCLNDSQAEDSPKSLTPQNCLKLEQSAKSDSKQQLNLRKRIIYKKVLLSYYGVLKCRLLCLIIA